MMIASWNVNSIRARQERLLKWLETLQPEVVCLQELKVVEEAFPFDALRRVGYFAVVYGQKTYNGVAILARTEPTDVEKGFGDSVEDDQARFIAGTVEGVRVLSVYVPNGAEVGSNKYEYKLEWLRRLKDYLEKAVKFSEPVVLCGDFNIAPEDRDVARPSEWEGSVLFNPEMRIWIRELLEVGFVDTFRLKQSEGAHYSWWDYRNLAFPRNNGLRIDYVFATRSMADRCTDALIDREERKGTKPSDHAPVLAEFN